MEEINNSQVADSTPEVSSEVSTPEPVQTSEVAASPEAKSVSKLDSLKNLAKDAIASPTDKTVAAKVSAYSPNFKFKSMDKELEFDEFIKGAIKDAEAEKKVRELYEKAHGLDYVKAERQKFREELGNTKTQYESLTKGLDHLSEMLTKDDFHGFFQALKIPEDKILKYALDRVNYRELPPEQRAQIDSQYEKEQKLSYYEQANAELLNNYQQTLVAQRASELDSYLGRPEISQVAQSFDARAGRPGAFRDEVIRRGQYYFSVEQKDIPVEQAAREVLMLVGQPSAQAAQQVDASPEPQGMMQNEKPVIPNIKSRSTASPAKKVVRSINDLRKKAAEFSAE